MSLGEGEKFAGYTIVYRLGSGGMGEVYLAQHPRLPRRDALKLLNSDISSDPVYRERFLREADAASSLWHPHIVGVHDRGEDNGQLWISMDFVDGEDAAKLLARKYPAGMPRELVIAIVSSVASALDYAHKQGLLHRDVKPANIMLTNVDNPAERRILLTDFGIARQAEDPSGLTATNTTLGTYAYSAPEQLMGQPMDGRADQYALAATAYQLLTGSTVFPHTTPGAVIGSHLNQAPPRLADLRPDLALLDPVLAAALAKNPDDRFALCTDFANALSEQAGKSSTRAPSAPTTPAPVWLQSQGRRETPLSNTAEQPATTVSSGLSTRVLVPLGLTVVALAGVIAFAVAKGTQQSTTPPLVGSSSSEVAPAPAPATVTVTRTQAPAPPVVEGSTGDLGLSVKRQAISGYPPRHCGDGIVTAP